MITRLIHKDPAVILPGKSESLLVTWGTEFGSQSNIWFGA